MATPAGGKEFVLMTPTLAARATRCFYELSSQLYSDPRDRRQPR